MEANVLDYEPHGALFVPDDNPLLFYRSISANAPQGRTSRQQALSRNQSALLFRPVRHA